MSFSFKISLHIDDINILYLIKEELKIGSINISKNNTYNTKSGNYVVNKFEDLVEVIVPLFKYARLRTIKRLDFEDWTKAIEIKKNSPLIRQNAYSISPEDFKLIIS